MLVTDDEEECSEEGHLILGTSHVFDHDFHQFRTRGYILDSSRCRSGGSSTTPDPREDEVVLFKYFFRVDFVSP